MKVSPEKSKEKKDLRNKKEQETQTKRVADNYRVAAKKPTFANDIGKPGVRTAQNTGRPKNKKREGTGT
jgi:hypothetical protein